MAKSPPHKFGQVIGDLVEKAVIPLLSDVAAKHDVYLDKKGSRRARKKKVVCWEDLFGNIHNLDFVLERGGSETKIGEPIAFIESAWRSYAKHSRNKAQEIEAAILPLVAKHSNNAPFVGAILAGVFTNESVKQLQSRGFKTLLFPYETIILAFQTVGIDATFGQTTQDEDVLKKVEAWNSLTAEQQAPVSDTLVDVNAESVAIFLAELERALTRQIDTISVLPLHGDPYSFPIISEALEFVGDYKESDTSASFVKYEFIIRYNNGDQVQAEFKDKSNALEFLRSYLPPFEIVEWEDW